MTGLPSELMGRSEDENEVEIPKEKSGKALFYELYRHFPLAKAEDYVKNGRWVIEQLETDTELIIANRMQAGAPEPPPLEEMKLPPVPALAPRPRLPPPPRPRAEGLGARDFGSGIPTAAGLVTRPLRPVPRVASKLVPQPPKGPPPAGALAAASPSPTGTTMLQGLTTEFIERWELEPKRARHILARLPPEKRRLVMRSFSEKRRTGELSENSPDFALEKYVEKVLDKSATSPSPSWGSGAPTSSQKTTAATPPWGRARTSTAPPPPASRSTLGVKRPLVGDKAESPEMSKRQRVSSAIGANGFSPTSGTRAPSTPLGSNRSPSTTSAARPGARAAGAGVTRSQAPSRSVGSNASGRAAADKAGAVSPLAKDSNGTLSAAARGVAAAISAGPGSLISSLLGK
mmetsp:Transcript_97040/g.274225  ORF Transcript_97040/g.274225 Transcript_97040/m.274225 type:complete len:403 (+) Transcript_97040:110-1318(+)